MPNKYRSHPREHYMTLVSGSMNVVDYGGFDLTYLVHIYRTTITTSALNKLFFPKPFSQKSYFQILMQDILVFPLNPGLMNLKQKYT
jgi:hypothetical protein